MNLEPAVLTQLKTLRLGGLLESLDLRLQEAQQASLGYLEFLQLLFQDELERREAKKTHLRLRKACFEQEKTLEGFDFSWMPGSQPLTGPGSLYRPVYRKGRARPALWPGRGR